MAHHIKGHLLLWVAFPKIRDGGVDVIYSEEEQKVVATFLGGYRG